MDTYELTIVLPGKSKPSKVKSVEEEMEKVIKTIAGKIEKKDAWGEIELATEIGKEGSGIFLHYEIQLKREAAKALNEKLKLEEDIIRYLLVRV